MTTPPGNNDARVVAVMDMLMQLGETPRSGFLSRVPWGMRFYVDQFLACGKLGGVKSPAALIQNCVAMARKGAAFHGNTGPGPQLRALAKLFKQHRGEAIAYAVEWEADHRRRFGDWG
jgi:hypothetical protein